MEKEQLCMQGTDSVLWWHNLGLPTWRFFKSKAAAIS
jgi:hypothetical protein